jgi:putative acetyltransferase
MPVLFAPIQIDHASSYRQCLDVVAQERRYLAQLEALPLEQIVGFVRDSVANDAVQFVALDGQRVVGWADIFPAWAHTIAHRGTLGMGVHPDYRQRGLGEALLRACIGKAKSKGLTRIELETRADNAASIALYQKVGFVHEAVKRNAMCFDGEYFDSVQMSMLV